ncbi:MAG: translation elongation factor Ts [Clostridia bacterium]
MNFTAKDVASLRAKTGCGMMDCKKALTDAQGDMEKATEILREKGLAASIKKAGRIAAEGIACALVSEDGKVGVVVEVNAETDFVAKNVSFQEFVKTCAKTVIAQNPADVEALLACTAEGSSETIDALLKDRILVIGENMKIRRFVRLEGNCVAYVHGGGRIGVLVKMDAEDSIATAAEFKECGEDVAMQIAALNPLYLSQTDVPAEDIDKEREVLAAQIQNDPKNSKKPANIIDKMIDGRIRKFYEQNCLLNQAFVKNGDMSVEKYVDSIGKKLGGSMKVVEFVRFEKGEGLEKREDNFADEVASMMK